MFKRKFDNRPLGAVLLLVAAMCMSAFAFTRTSDDWTLNPSDYRYDMSLYFTVDPALYANMDANEIGAFVGDDCRGIAQKLSLPDDELCLYMRVRSNEAEGEEISLRVREKESGNVYNLVRKDGEPLKFASDAMLGLPSDPVVMLPVFSVSAEASEHGSVTVEAGDYPYGSVVEFNAIPDEGYHFELWSDESRLNPREVTVTSPVKLSAVFAPNSYNLTFNLDGQLYQMKSVLYGDPVEAPEVPEIEGYTFSGWGDVPTTMPAQDLVFDGVYEAIKYRLSLVVDGEVFRTFEVAYGTPLNKSDYDGFVPDDREGHSFSGWSELPATMPAHDIEVTGTYSVNSYKLTFLLNGDVYEMRSLPYGTEIVTPTPPEVEGTTFAGWGDVPATMPAYDLVLSGTYTYNGYFITFIVDDEVIAILPFTFGDKIEYPEVAEKEGHYFSGWSESPETMPARDLVLTGEYVPNLYKYTLYLDGEVYKEDYLSYGMELKFDNPEEKEGYSFSGWGDLLLTMPAHDVEFYGYYIANTYTITLIIDGATYEVLSFVYGSPVTLPEIPEKLGYTFSGFENVPETMPAYNLELTGSYIANLYKLTVYLDDAIYMEDEIPYGERIIIPEPQPEEGYEFAGWDIEVPVRMPAYDLVVRGTTREIPVNGVNDITLSEEYGEIESVYDLNGRELSKDGQLDAGIYVINGKKVVIK